MAYYTTRLQDVVESESHYGSPMKMTTKERIEFGRGKIFDFDYPLFDEAYRQEFETKFIRAFYFNELSEEVFGLWKFKLENWLNLHMSYYNQLYLSTLIHYDPLVNSDYKVTSLGKKNVKFDEKGQHIVDNSVDKTGSKHFADDTVGTSQNDGTSDTNVTTDTNGENHTKGNTNTDTKNDGTSDTTKNGSVGDIGSKDVTETGKKDSTSFTRKIGSDTPDSRLEITTNSDGTGVIEYASNIDETSVKSHDDTESTLGEKTKNDKTITETDKNTTSDTGNSKTDANSDADYKENMKGNTDTTTHDEGKTSKNTVQNTETTEGVKGNVKGSNDRNNMTDEVKDYIEHRVGKQGTMTYPEMVMEFRKAMINVDELVLKHMRKELFMIIY